MSTYVLGVSFSGGELYGALVEQTDEGRPVVQFTVSSADADDVDPALPGDSGFSEGGSETGGPAFDADDDVTIQFGDEGGGHGEGVLGDSDDAAEDEGDAALVQSQLSRLLTACEERGYEDPEIALCSPVGEIDDVELRLPEPEETDASPSSARRPLPADRSVLIERLEDQYDGAVEEERVGFVPLHPTEDGHPRVLALIARPGGPVLSTLATMQEQTLSRPLRVALLESDVSMYEGLARLVQEGSADPDQTTAVVHVGVDDTFVLFMRGNTLLKFEHLPELTADDPVETVCSRVLLLRDEYGVGHIRHLLLALEENEADLETSFRQYFPEANTELIRSALPGGGEDGQQRYTTAVGVAIRYLRRSEAETPFRPINLLPGRYATSSFRLPVEWSVPVLLALIGLTTLGIVWYYVANAQAIGERQAQLRSLNQQIEQVDRPALEGRVETLQATANRYEKGMQTLDDLLKGSNRWSRQLAALTQSVRAVSGLSIRQWRTDDGAVALTGRANDRIKVVELVRRLNGTIDALSFTKVREVTLYDFKITVPLDTVKPQVVKYWNQQQTTKRAAAMTGTQATTESNSPQTTGEAVQTIDRHGSSSSPAAVNTGSWTIVVGSLTDRESAQVVQERFRGRLSDTGHQVRVYYSPDNSRYRVGVGAFPSRDRARAVLRDLKPGLPSDAWIHDRLPMPNESPVTAESHTNRQ